ncbi:hypothetical protein LTR08_006852 [Meristemomyces frigidus]|nr:hypothetical protein LTR08_006852 [Meristemomyces frigidus]
MQYTLLLAAAALAHAHDGHRRFHNKRLETVVETVDVVETDVVTVTEYMTPSATPSVTLDVKNHWHSWSAKQSSSEAASSSVQASSAAPSPASSSVSTPPASSSSAAWSSTSSVSTTFATSAAATYASPSAYTTSSAAPSSATSAATSSSGISVGNLTPNGKKAGLSGYVGIQNIDAFSDLAPYISWYSDYTANTPDEQGVKGIGMLWGADGSACSDTTDRLDTFTSMMDNNTVPEIMFGFYEPDCECTMSSEMSTDSAASAWDKLFTPLGKNGTVLGSPSMCTQYNEDFLTPFNSSISRTWDVTSIHINKPNKTEAAADVDYYVKTYGKPVWVTEFACVNDQPIWAPCTDQDQINTFINDVVKYFEGNDNVVAYGPSNGEGLGDVWPLTDSSTGSLTTSGQTYLNAIKGLTGRSPSALAASTALHCLKITDLAETSDHTGHPVHHGRLRLNGIRLHYITAGSGPALLLLYGTPKNSFYWYRFFPLLTSHFTLVALHLRGFGYTNKPPATEGYDSKTNAKDVADLMTHLGHESFYLHGRDQRRIMRMLSLGSTVIAC